MIGLVFALIGAIVGAATARRRKGAPADIAQYAVGFGIAFGLAGMFAGILLEKFVFS